MPESSRARSTAYSPDGGDRLLAGRNDGGSNWVGWQTEGSPEESAADGDRHRKKSMLAKVKEKAMRWKQVLVRRRLGSSADRRCDTIAPAWGVNTTEEENDDDDDKAYIPAIAPRRHPLLLRTATTTLFRSEPDRLEKQRTTEVEEQNKQEPPPPPSEGKSRAQSESQDMELLKQHVDELVTATEIKKSPLPARVIVERSLGGSPTKLVSSPRSPVSWKSPRSCSSRSPTSPLLENHVLKHVEELAERNLNEFRLTPRAADGKNDFFEKALQEEMAGGDKEEEERRRRWDAAEEIGAKMSCDRQGAAAAPAAVMRKKFLMAMQEKMAETGDENTPATATVAGSKLQAYYAN